jgi:NADPH:quinone reductase-like Zn-dependent oxidoreductase
VRGPRPAHAVRVDFVDIDHRSSLYPIPLLAGLGSEGAGVVEAAGPDVTAVRPGDRVAYAGGPSGSYAEQRVMPADRLVGRFFIRCRAPELFLQSIRARPTATQAVR